MAQRAAHLHSLLLARSGMAAAARRALATQQKSPSNVGEDLYSLPVEVASGYDGKKHTVNDTNPNGSPVGTVVTTHGSPGTHLDFKYITPLLTKYGIRVVGINFPGFGYTPSNFELRQNRPERTALIQSIVDGLRLDERLVFMGHSRGAESAVTLAANNLERTTGAILVNPMGLPDIPKGMQPFWALEAVDNLYRRGDFTRAVVRKYLYWYYNNILGLKVPHGDEAAAVLRTMRNLTLAPLKEDVEKLNQARGKVKTLMTTAGKDFLVQNSNSMNLHKTFDNCPQWVVEGHEGRTTGDPELQKRYREALQDGIYNVHVHFPTETHYLQKQRATFIADATLALLEVPKQKL